MTTLTHAQRDALTEMERARVDVAQRLLGDGRAESHASCYGLELRALASLADERIARREDKALLWSLACAVGAAPNRSQITQETMRRDLPPALNALRQVIDDVSQMLERRQYFSGHVVDDLQRLVRDLENALTHARLRIVAKDDALRAMTDVIGRFVAAYLGGAAESTATALAKARDALKP